MCLFPRDTPSDRIKYPSRIVTECVHNLKFVFYLLKPPPPLFFCSAVISVLPTEHAKKAVELLCLPAVAPLEVRPKTHGASKHWGLSY